VETYVGACMLGSDTGRIPVDPLLSPLSIRDTPTPEILTAMSVVSRIRLVLVLRSSTVRHAMHDKYGILLLVNPAGWPLPRAWAGIILLGIHSAG